MSNKHDTHGAPPTKVHVGPAEGADTGKKASWVLWLIGLVVLLLLIWFFFMRDDAAAATAPVEVPTTSAATLPAENIHQ